MSEKPTIITYDGLKRLEAQLQDLKLVRRKEVADKIKEARGQGDLSENAEFDAAKEEQVEIETMITSLEKKLRNALVIDEEDLDQGSVNVGSRVTVLDIEMNEEIEYFIVGSTEADPINGRISNESPLGMALLQHKIDDIVSVEAPDGIIEYKIIDIASKGDNDAATRE